MLKHLEKYQTLIGIMLTAILLATFLFLPVYVQLVSIVILSISVSIAIVLIYKKHWHTYQDAECTHEKMTRNLSLDLLGMFLTLGVVMYVGRLAGAYFGLLSGFWVGIIAGFAGGFVAAWAVRSAWGKLVRA